MIHYLQKDRWSPYIVGILIGGLLSGLFMLGHQIGVSSGVSRLSAVITWMIAPSSIEPGSYFATLLANHVIFDWKILFVIGLFIGAWVASRLSTEHAPPKNTIWIKRFGSSKMKRYFAAFIGGFLLLTGARLAGGCTSGHAISGGAQLSFVSWIFMLTLFATAIPVSYFLYKKP